SDAEKIKEAIDIVSFIGRYVKLKHVGRNFQGLCPFHQDTSPSFTVSAERQFWYCFGCNRGGDIFSFLMEQEGLDFPEALRILAQQAGITLTHSEEKTSSDRKLRVQGALEMAAHFYHYLLTEHNVGKAARDYLKKRQISDESIKKFNLGYAPASWSTTSNFLRQRGFSEQELFDAGLTIERRQKKGWYDRFRQRIVFVLRDHLGRYVGFSGRALTNDQSPKYLNSPETILFKKNRFLYGLHEGKVAIREKKEVVLVEGNLDIVTAHQHGIENIVAPLGTGLTENQVILLKRFASKFFICFDGDEAGRKAILRALEIVQPQEVEIMVIQIGDERDLDEVLRENPALFTKLKSEALPAFQYLVAQGKKEFDINLPTGKVEFLKLLAPFWNKTISPVTKQSYIQILAEELGIQEKLIESDLQRFQSQDHYHPASQQKSDAPSIAAKDRCELLCEHLLNLFLQGPPQIGKNENVKKLIKEFEPLLTDPRLQSLWRELKAQILHAELNLDELQKKLSPSEGQLLNLLILKSSEELISRDDFLKELHKTVHELRRACWKKELNKVSIGIKKAEGASNEKELKRLKKELNKISQELAKELVN
ncbi:DNA primase, partial [Patescibacteria group bacterium]|nr:DNA primase [Patescibacteria group bacterium]